jgi:hypothetical protein
MRESIRLDVATLKVESFIPAPTPPKPEPLTTCGETNCGIRFCCA